MPKISAGWFGAALGTASRSTCVRVTVSGTVEPTTTSAFVLPRTYSPLLFVLFPFAAFALLPSGEAGDFFFGWLPTPPDGICNPVRNVLCNGKTLVCGHNVRVGICNPDPRQVQGRNHGRVPPNGISRPTSIRRITSLYPPYMVWLVPNSAGRDL